MLSIYSSKEFEMIKNFYGVKVAKRSQIPLINHIKEGLEIMEANEASLLSMRAYCLHPILQSDKDFEANFKGMGKQDPLVILLTMEYRRAANAYLCKSETDNWFIDDAIAAIGILIPEIKSMLIADKIQNRKDFLRCHYGTHPRSTQLNQYFKNWFKILGIRENT
jgi:hypothetical protein